MASLLSDLFILLILKILNQTNGGKSIVFFSLTSADL